MLNECGIAKLNGIIKEAILHGGDSGGAYFSNRDCLVKKMSEFLRWSGLDKTYGIMDENGWIRFYNKGHIVE